MIHKFHVGQKVRLSGRHAHGGAPTGSYEVIGQLPSRNGDNQYRIKSTREPHQRVAGEHDLQASDEQTEIDALFRPLRH